MTALFLACSHGNYEVMKLLVGAFADVNARARVSLKHSAYHMQHVLCLCVEYVPVYESTRRVHSAASCVYLRVELNVHMI